MNARYPLTYAILVLPLSIVRWRQFELERKHPEGKHFTPGPSITVLCLFAMSGVTNVCLLLYTRPALQLFGAGAEGAASRTTEPGLGTNDGGTDVELEASRYGAGRADDVGGGHGMLPETTDSSHSHIGNGRM
jgi:hypothetical protein